MKKFLLPLQNMVRDDLFSGSLAVWNVCGFAVMPPFTPSPDCEAIADEDKIPFELSLKYTANQDFASQTNEPRGGFAAARQRFERAFSLKTKTVQ